MLVWALNKHDWMTTQILTDGDYSTLKPHYIISDYGFNPDTDIN